MSDVVVASPRGNGTALFRLPCNFVASAPNAESIPAGGLPEVAFAGRSNVGKSSLINGLVRRRNLARTSSTPGRTQLLNFFNLGDQLMLVDLPGFGYAKANKKEVQRWTKFTEAYLLGRQQLRRVCFLIDSRRGLMEQDREVMSRLDDTAVPYQIILTKIDKLKASERNTLIPAIETELKTHPAALNEVLLTSSEKNIGIDELRDVLAGLL